MGYGRINANETNEQMSSNMMSLTYPVGTAGALPVASLGTLMVATFFLGLVADLVHNLPQVPNLREVSCIFLHAIDSHSVFIRSLA
jgi:hypothetical protein